MTKEKILYDEGYVTTKDDVRLFFQKVGAGSPVVLIPNALYMFDDFRHLAASRTLIFYDMRNRGRSDHIVDKAKLCKGIHHDVEDLEAVRQHFGSEKVALIGHSYLGLMVILYAMRHSDHVERIVQIGALPRRHGASYPAHLRNQDQVLAQAMHSLEQLQKTSPPDPGKYCKQWWSILRRIFVANAADASKISDACCAYSNEWPEHQMGHFSDNIFPSIEQLDLLEEDLALVPMPVLTIHGTKDRQAPYGGGREWALALSDARLLTVDGGAHMPWIEQPERVFSAIDTFLRQHWPKEAERIAMLDPQTTAT